jgi:hypothetical protein
MGESVEHVLAVNLGRLMEAHPDLSTDTKLGARTKLGQRTIYRMLRAQTSPRLESLQAVARQFDLQPWQLLVPGLDPKNPPVLRFATKKEHEMYERWRQVMEEMKNGRSNE